jgi:hypothetical protein
MRKRTPQAVQRAYVVGLTVAGGGHFFSRAAVANLEHYPPAGVEELGRVEFASVAGWSPELTLLGVIALIFLGALVEPWIVPAARLLLSGLLRLAVRALSVLVDRLLDLMVIAVIALVGGLSWLSGLLELLAGVFR